MDGAFPQQFTHFLAACQGFAADDQAACIPVQPVAYGRPEGPQLVRSDFSPGKQVIRQPFVQGIILCLRFLRKQSGRFIHQKDMLVFKDNWNLKVRL